MKFIGNLHTILLKNQLNALPIYTIEEKRDTLKSLSGTSNQLTSNSPGLQSSCMFGNTQCILKQCKKKNKPITCATCVCM